MNFNDKIKEATDPKKAFRLPEGYFNDLEFNLKQSMKNETKSQSTDKRVRWISPLSLAASMIIFAVLSYAAIRIILPETSRKESVEPISIAAIDADLLSDEELFELYSETTDPVFSIENDQDYYDFLIGFLSQEDISLNELLPEL